MPILPATTSQYLPTLETVLNLVRALANDSFAGASSTPGEGQILTDLNQGSTTVANPFLLAHLNSAIREMYRKLRNVKTPALVRDNIILLNLPVVNGPLGPSVPDPSIQTSLSFAGYFDGSVVNTGFTLPSDLLMPLKLWDRLSNSNDIFVPLKEYQDGIDPANQTDMFVVWEWREGQINFRGALAHRDLRIRYLAFLPEFFPSPVPANYFTTTQIPIFDCQEAVAYIAMKNIARSLGSPLLASFDADAKDAMFDLRNQQVRRMQGIRYARNTYDDQDSQGLDIYGI